MNEIKELIPFNNACEELIAGKYILADIKIASILKIVETNEKIKNIVATCLEDFNFKISFSAAIKQTNENFSFVLPEQEKNLVALVYSLLCNINNGTINFTDFLNRFYSLDNSTDISLFANEIIVPFKNAINSLFSKRHIIVETNDYQNNIYNKLKTNIKLILTNIDNFKLKITEKEEFTMLLNSLYIASEKNDKKLVYSLMIGIDYFSKATKRVRNAYLSLEECFT